MKQKKTAAALRLCALLLVITALAGWFLTQKSGYHLDEGLSLSLANSEGDWEYRTLFYEPGGLRQFCLDHVCTGGFFASIRNVFTIGLDYLRNGQDSPWYAIYSENYAPALGEMAWVNGAEHFVRHATVTDGNLFSRLLTVYANQASDVHPPLYYLLLNLICSFFPGTYSNWYPFAVNIVFLLLACVMLYRIARRFGEETLALVSVALYGLSCGFVSTAVLFRMYAVLTFFCCWALSCHLRLQEEGWRASRGTAWQLVLVNVFGFYTQYYFIIYSAFLALVSLICMLARRRGKDALRYLGLMLLAACASLVIWPFSVYHIFGGYRGAEAFANANFAQFAEHLEEYGAILSGALLGGSRKLALALAGLIGAAAVIAALRAGKKNPVAEPKPDVRAALVRWLLVLCPAVGYFLIVMQIAPYQVDRYVMCLYPSLALTLACAIAFVIRQLCRSRALQACLLAAAVLALSAFGMYRAGPNYLYREVTPITECTDAFDEGPVDLIVFDSNLSRLFTELPNYEQVIWLVDSSWNLLDALNGVNYLTPPANPEASLVIEIPFLFDAQTFLDIVGEQLDISVENAELIREIPYKVNTYLIRTEKAE